MTQSGKPSALTWAIAAAGYYLQRGRKALRRHRPTKTRSTLPIRDTSTGTAGSAVLRTPELDDGEALYLARLDLPEVVPPWWEEPADELDRLQALDAWRSWLAKSRAPTREGLALPLVVEAGGAVVGVAELHSIDKATANAELRFWIPTAGDNEWLAEVAISALIDHAFRAQRAGLRFEATMAAYRELAGKPRDYKLLAATRD
jgi:RimJ/RimL family protein N-acetyltransferase